MTEEKGRLARAAGVVGFFTFLSRLTGLLRDMVIGYLFGAQGAADAYFVAFRIPNLLRRLTAEGALTVAFIPVFTNTLAKEGKEEAAKVSNIIFTFVSLLLGLITLLGIVFAEPLTRLFAPGFLGDPKKFNLTVLLTQWMFPYILMVSLVALAMGVLNSLRHFMAPATSTVLFNLSTIACAIALSPLLKEPVLSLAYGVLFGGLAQLLFQIPYLSRHGMFPNFDFDFRHPALGRLLYLMGPAVFGAAVYQINVLVSTILASLLPGGSVSYLYYADRFLEFPVGIFAIALGTAALPSFSSLVAKGDIVELRATLTYSLRLVNFISLPATLGMIAVAIPIFALFFQRGAFDAATTRHTAIALIYYSLGLWGISGTKLVVPVFYALEDTRTPMWVGFLSFVINLLASIVLMGEVAPGESSVWFIASGITRLSAQFGVFSLAHGGLALATSISSTFNFLVLLFLLHRRLEGLPLREIFISFFRNFTNAFLTVLPLLWIAQKIDWTGGTSDDLSYLVVVFVLLVGSGISLYFAVSFLLRSPEWPVVCELGSGLKRRLRYEKRA